MVFNGILFLFIFQEIISPAIITKSVSKLCSKQNLTDYSITHDNKKALHSFITKDQSCTNKNKTKSKSSLKLYMKIMILLLLDLNRKLKKHCRQR